MTEQQFFLREIDSRNRRKEQHKHSTTQHRTAPQNSAVLQTPSIYPNPSALFCNVTGLVRFLNLPSPPHFQLQAFVGNRWDCKGRHAGLFFEHVILLDIAGPVVPTYICQGHCYYYYNYYFVEVPIAAPGRGQASK